MHDIIHDHDHPHEHVGPDGKVYTHTHAPAEDHTHTHVRADGTEYTHTHGDGLHGAQSQSVIPPHEDADTAP